MSQGEFDDPRVSAAVANQGSFQKDVIIKLVASYERMVQLQKNPDVAEKISDASNPQTEDSVSLHKPNVPAILQGTGAFLYPLADLYENQSDEVTNLKQFNKILESKYWNLTKEKSELQNKIWKDIDYSADYEKMMQKMVSVIEKSNLSIRQYIEKTKGCLQDIECELRYDDKAFWNRITEQDRTIHFSRGLSQELSTVVIQNDNKLLDINKSINGLLKKKDDTLDMMSQLLLDFEDHYDDIDIKEHLEKLDSMAKDIESINKEISQYSTSINNIQRDTMILEDLKGYLKQQEQRLFTYREHLERYDSEGKEVEEIPQGTKQEELGNFALERQVEMLSEQLEILKKQNTEQEIAIQEKDETINTYETQLSTSNLKNDNDRLSNELAKATDTISELTKNEKLYRAKIRKLLLNRGIAYIEDMYDSMTDDRKKLVELEKDNVQLKATNEQYKQMIIQQKEENESAESMMTEKLQSLNKEIADKKGELEKCSIQLSEKEGIILSQKEDIMSYLNTLKELESHIENMKNRIGNIDNEKQLAVELKEKEFDSIKVNYESKISSLETALNQKDVSIQEYTNKINILNTEKTSLENQMERKGQEVSILQEARGNDIENLQKEKDILLKQYEDIKKEYEEYKNSMIDQVKDLQNNKGIDVKEVDLLKEKIKLLETSLEDEKNKFSVLENSFEEEKKKYQETIDKNTVIINELKAKTVRVGSGSEQMTLEQYQNRVNQLVQENNSLQQQLLSKDDLYKQQINKQIALYTSLKNSISSQSNTNSSNDSNNNHDKCIEREKDLRNKNIELDGEIQKLKIDITDLNRQIGEDDIKYKTLQGKYEYLLNKEQVEVPIDVHELQHSLKEKCLEIELLTNKIKLLEDSIDPRGIARNEQNIRIFLNMNINLDKAIQDYVGKFIHFDIFALDMIEREGGIDGLFYSLIYSILDVSAQTNIMKRLLKNVKNQESELQRLITKGILVYIRNSMNLFEKDLPLQRQALMFLAKLSPLYEKNVDAFMKNSIYQCIYQSFQSNRSDKIIQKYTFTSYSYLLQNADALKGVAKQGFSHYLLSILASKAVDPIVAEQGFTVLNLIIDTKATIKDITEMRFAENMKCYLISNMPSIETSTTAYNTVVNIIFVLQKCCTDFTCLDSFVSAGIFTFIMNYLKSSSLLYEDIVNQFTIFIKFACAYDEIVPSLLSSGLLDVVIFSSPLYINNQDISLNLLAIYIKIAEIDPYNASWTNNNGMNSLISLEKQYINVPGVQAAVDNAVNNLSYYNGLQQ
ncbi:hypothetical protein WA158_006549 [Blastocystis sp. Blastoise]